jgi:5'(3')-deoxyribonucleotidase
MKIGIDLDDVLADTMPVLVAYHNDMYGTTLTKDDVWSYRLWDVVGVSQEETLKRIYAFERSAKLMDIAPMPGAKRAIDSLRGKHELSIITARDSEFADITKHWMTRYFPDVFSEIHFANHHSPTATPRSKGDICREIGASVMIDDSFNNVLSCHNVCDDGVLLFDAPWNINEQLLDGMHRVSSWHDIVERIP